MRVILQLLLSVILWSAVSAGPEFDKYFLRLDNASSQSATGYIYRPSQTNFMKMQKVDRSIDILNKRFRATRGSLGEENYQQVFTFINNTNRLWYQSGTLVCSSFPSPLIFDNVVGAYLYPYLRFLGFAPLGDQVYLMFAGSSPDPIANVEVPNVIFVHALYSLITFQTLLNEAGFNYVFLSNITRGSPSNDWLTLPTQCTQGSTTPCNPACGNNARCNASNACECLNGYSGDPLTNCGALNTEFKLENTFVYDQYLLDNNSSDVKSQTCFGDYVDPITNKKQHSAWIQDIEGQRFRFDVGKPGEDGAITYLYTAEGSYTVKYGSNSQASCSTVDTKYTFAHVYNDTFYPTLRYLGETVYNNVSCRMYAGVGRLHDTSGEKKQGMIKYIAKEGSQFNFMALLNNQGYTYFDYYNTQMGRPGDSWFNKDQLCTSKSGASAVHLINSFSLFALAGILTLYHY